ncbi:MAG: PilZ domain-containing protein [Proteobacteria bacterium]|nr:PilZ domain-containing protein [Pseudomonadota bacterium]
MTRCTITARRPFDQKVLLWVPGQEQSVTARARDLGQGGIFVRLSQPPPVDSELRLSFDVPGAGPVEATAVVVRVTSADDPLDPPGVALRFSALAACASARLACVLAPRPSFPVVSLDHDDEWDPVHTDAYAQHASSRRATPSGVVGTVAR